jgi:uncharacterized protein
VLLDVSTTEKRVDKSFDFDLTEKFNRFKYNGKMYDFESEVSFIGNYTPFDGYITVVGIIKCQVKTVCDKCLKDALVDLSVQYFEKFVRDSDEQEEYAFNSNKMVLDQSIMDNIVLNLPLYSYCKSNCNGLCKYCGKDLNIEKCDCEQENLKTNSPFGVLGDLFENKEV